MAQSSDLAETPGHKLNALLFGFVTRYEIKFAVRKIR